MQKNLKKASRSLAKKKKKIARGAATLEKNENILLINIQEKDAKSCAILKTTRERGSKDYAGIRERNNSFSGSCPFFRAFFPFCYRIYSLSSSSS